MTDHLAHDPVASAMSVREAWRHFCDRLRETGDLIIGDGYPEDPIEQAEGFRYLSRLLVMGVQRAFEHQDPNFPAFLRYNDDVTKWGGPNTDNNYLLASVDGEGEYVITGTALNPRGFIIQTGTGGMESGTVEIFGEKTDRDFEFEPAVDFHIVLSATPRSGNWMALHPRTTEVSIREYFVNWEHDQTCRFRIDRIDQTATAPQRLDPAAVADKLDTAGRWVERSLVFWNEFYRDRLPVANAISTAPLGVAGGAENIVYGSGRWSLDTGEGLLVELEEPRARYWSLQLYSTGWFESLDFANRQTSLNGHQMHIDADGLVRIIISGTDPGIDNWLDTERRRNGIVIFRSIGTDERASLTCQVIPLTDIRARLPSATPHVSTDQRQAVIGQRRAGIARRFRR